MLGVGKACANDRGQAGRQVQEWRVLFLSTGEKTLTQHMAAANKEPKAGMEAYARRPGRSWHVRHAHGGNTLQHAQGTGGEPLTAFLKALCEPGKRHCWSAILRRTLEGFIARSLPASTSGQAHRAAARFNLAPAAGELATAMGITVWPDGIATTPARLCLNAWLNERGGAGNFEGDAILAAARDISLADLLSA